MTRTCLFCEEELDADNPSPFCDDICRLRAAEVKGYVEPPPQTARWGRKPQKRTFTFHRRSHV